MVSYMYGPQVREELRVRICLYIHVCGLAHDCRSLVSQIIMSPEFLLCI